MTRTTSASTGEHSLRSSRTATRGSRSSGRDVGLFYPLDDEGFPDFVQTAVAPNDLLLSKLEYNPAVRSFSAAVGRARLYQLSPLECRKPGVSTPNADIDLHGGNLPALVAYIQANHPAAWASVLLAMRRIVPSLVDVSTTFTHDRRLTLQFHEEGVGRPWTSEDVSDGTIQSLAVFTALFDPLNPLAIIEEPENSVHPWIVRTFVDACREVATKQTVVTTHSPALIDYLTPEEVMLVCAAMGEPRLRALCPCSNCMRCGSGRRAKSPSSSCWIADCSR